jgi:antitoxin component of RelBE/YafQ-DinJ toxin-antitoxin module
MDATITIRTNKDIKQAAQARAEQLGLSLSDVLNNSLRRFIKGEKVVYDDDYSEEYIAELLKASDEADRDYKAGKLKAYTPDDFVAMLRARTAKNRAKQHIN